MHSAQSKKAHYRELRSTGFQHCGRHSLANRDDQPINSDKVLCTL
jgi:hypothetical protein